MNRPRLRKLGAVLEMVPLIVRAYANVLGNLTGGTIRAIRTALADDPDDACPTCGSTNPWTFDEPCRARMLRDQDVDPWHPKGGS